LGARRVSGFDVVADATGLSELVRDADLVITGEGRLDGPSLAGKVVGGVARVAAESGVPVVVLAGEVRVGRRELGAAGVAEAYALVDAVGKERALADPAASLAELTAVVARGWGA
ncbi:MAG: glycerate kinase, partial [Actinomycetota bacterium]|nr:glycerate kinase [Actinomycetota bacterium]